MDIQHFWKDKCGFNSSVHISFNHIKAQSPDVFRALVLKHLVPSLQGVP